MAPVPRGSTRPAPHGAGATALRGPRRITLVGILMALGFAVTFGTAWFAEPLARLTFLGWPLSYYVAAQGAIIVYVGILVAYATIEGRKERAEPKR